MMNLRSSAKTCLASLGLFFCPMETIAGSVVVKAPCSATAEPGLKPCQEYVVNGTPARGTANQPGYVPALPSALAQIHKRIDTQINGDSSDPSNPVLGYYQHVDPNPMERPGLPFGPTVCNLVPNEFNGQTSETTVDHLPQPQRNSCGNPVDIKINFNAGVIRIPLVGRCATIDPRDNMVTTINKRWNADPALAKGTLEDGYVRGGLIQATACFYAQVTQEIRTRNQITVSDFGSDPSSCSALAADLVGMSQSMNNSTLQLQGKLTGQANIRDIMNCTKDWDTSRTENRDIGPLRQSAQFLCAARTGIEALFVELATCEILARSHHAYIANIGSATKQRELVQLIRTRLTQECANECQSNLNISQCNVPTPAQVSQCANTCYQRRMPPLFKDRIESLWKSDGSRCDLGAKREDPKPIAGSEGLLLIGMIGFIPRKKRRPEIAILAILQFGYFALSMGSGGCATGIEEATIALLDGPPDCTVESIDQGCCPIRRPTCSTDLGGSGRIGPTLMNSALIAGSVTSNLRSAESNLSPEGTQVANNGNLSQQGASAGDVASTSSNKKAGASDNNKLSNTNSGTLGRDASGSGKGRGASGSGSGGFVAAGLSTQPSTPVLAGNSDAGSADSASSTYKGGGASATESSTSDSGYLGNRRVEVGTDGTAPTEASLGASSGENTTLTAGTGDPEDYFARMGLGDNIFKVVEKKYREKSGKWAASDAAQALGKPSKVELPPN